MSEVVLICPSLPRTAETIAVTVIEWCKNGLSERPSKKHKPYKGVCMCEYIFYHYTHALTYRGKNTSDNSDNSDTVPIT